MKSFVSPISVVALGIGALAAPAPAATAAVDGSYETTVLKHHNVHRANHSAPDVAWGTYMASWAMHLAARCDFAHNTSIGDKSYGQNIAAGTEPYDISYVISDEFYNGEVNWFDSLYGQPSPSANFSHWGHFSQLVWAGTTHVGCATYNCTATGIGGLQGLPIAPYMTVCNYWPAGNVGGEYAANVGEPLNQPTVTGSY